VQIVLIFIDLIEDEQFHGIGLLLELLSGLPSGRADHIVVVSIITINDHLVIPEEHVANDRIHDARIDHEHQYITVEIHIPMQCVRDLDLVVKEMLLILLGRSLVQRPRLGVLPVVMASVFVR